MSQNARHQGTSVFSRRHGVRGAESDETVVVEGNHYFPAGAVDPACLSVSNTRSTCPWKGEAHYYTLLVDGASNLDAAWYYPDPKDAAAQIKDHVAFWRGVTIEESG